MNKKYLLGACLLIVLSLGAMHNESKEQQALKDRDDVRFRVAACLNRLMSRGKKRLKHSSGGAYEKREKIYDTIEYGDFAVMTWDGGKQQ